jgi:luciferase family oxidoreductase group 1
MTAHHVPLSVLDLASVSEGQSAKDALDASLESARLADRTGYSRYWYAEHHNTDSIVSSATSLLIDRAAAATERIRVGSGGIMLPNHSPLSVAEQFGTLAHFHDHRIDLGLGRAPGTDRVTAQMLARTASDPQSFAEAVYMMQGWMGDEGRPGEVAVDALVAKGTNVPMWMLGSTANGGSIGGQLGLPFSVASHFAPDTALGALETYRTAFTADQPTAQIDAPRTMLGVNVLVADTDEEAERQFTTVLQMFASMATGRRGPLQPPRPLSEIGAVQIVEHARSMLRMQAVGSPATVVARLEELVRQTGADEVITVTYAYDPAVRLRSLELLADAWLG